MTAAAAVRHPRAETSAVRRAVTEAAPVVVGYLPFALLVGTTAAASAVDPLVGWAASPMLYGGAAQLVLLRLLDADAPALVVLASVLTVNARLTLYSVAVAPAFASFPTPSRLVGSFVLTDPLFALSTVYFEAVANPSARRRYYLAAGLVFWATWSVTTAVGMVAASALASSAPLDFAVPLTFLPMLAAMLRNRAALAAAACGALAALAASGLPFNLGLLLGPLAGMLAGLLVEERDG
jgi:predicted branched-subunit amino acid permease